MAKSRKNSVMKTIGKTLPVVNTGLQKVGRTAKSATKASLPILEKGVAAVYGTMAKGVDLGVKGIKSVTKTSRSLAGGRRRRTRRHRRR